MEKIMRTTGIQPNSVMGTRMLIGVLGVSSDWFVRERSHVDNSRPYERRGDQDRNAASIHRRLTAEPFRVRRILEQKAQFLRKIFWIIGPADKSVDTILNDLGECSRSRRDERASLRHGFRCGQSEGFIPRADHRDRCLASKAGERRMGLMIEPLDPAGLPGPGDLLEAPYVLPLAALVTNVYYGLV